MPRGWLRIRRRPLRPLPSSIARASAEARGRSPSRKRSPWRVPSTLAERRSSTPWPTASARRRPSLPASPQRAHSGLPSRRSVPSRSAPASPRVTLPSRQPLPSGWTRPPERGRQQASTRSMASERRSRQARARSTARLESPSVSPQGRSVSIPSSTLLRCSPSPAWRVGCSMSSRCCHLEPDRVREPGHAGSSSGRSPHECAGRSARSDPAEGPGCAAVRSDVQGSVSPP